MYYILQNTKRMYQHLQGNQKYVIIGYKYSDEIKAEGICFLRQEFRSKCSINSTSIFFFRQKFKDISEDILSTNKYQIFLSAKEMNIKLLQNKNSDCHSSQKSSRLHLRALWWFGTNFQVQTTLHGNSLNVRNLSNSNKMHFKQLFI